MKYATDPSELSEGSIRCRAFGHVWRQHGATELDNRARGWAVTLLCSSCSTLKLFQLTRRGELSQPRYVYPDRYLAKFFIGADERAEFRLEALADILPGYTPKLTAIAGGRAG